ncbi:hypothetical protein NQ318_007550 [Aromia moschata]|uniref:Reverse transcriptase domain-containing protein n=1 Tax=Aromia moschata TaxID=1265417 RepID=A0AAV8YG88_9CUCU|nr:hypothetical protein NQ318_007550 [Aromia moschata]
MWSGYRKPTAGEADILATSTGKSIGPGAGGKDIVLFGRAWFLDQRQYGFRSGRGTIMAVGELVKEIRGNKGDGWHTLVVALDLTNAFGTAWGPSITERMRECGLGGEMERMVKSFLSEREIKIEGREWKIERGCPQGSSLGPILWLLVMQGWFAKMREIGVSAQAFADDQVIILRGKSAKAIERRWDECWTVCMDWAKENKLDYNVAKIEAMFVPAERDQRASGVRVDRKLMWLDHVKEVRKKVQEVGGEFFALARRKWGNRNEILKVIYERVVCPMVLYGAEIWGERGNDSRIIKQLRAIQRPFLRSMTRAYRTAPTAALSVLAGCVPLEVQVGVRYEREIEWGERMRDMKVVVRDRPHPNIRGTIPTIQGREGQEIIVKTDSQYTVKGLENYKTEIGVIVKIRKDIERAWGGEGIRIRVVWEKRGSEGNKKAEQKAKEALEREGEEMRDIVTKGRVMTGHGDMKAYLVRFRLIEGRRMDELHRNEWEGVIEWANELIEKDE